MIISRKDAIHQGLTHYFTGKSCKRGHVSERTTTSGNCLACWRDNEKLQRENDTDAFRAKKAKEYSRNKNAILQQQKQYRIENWDKIYAKRLANPDFRQRANEYFRQYYKNDTNRAKHLARIRYRQLKIKQRTPSWAQTVDEQNNIKQLYVQAALLTRETGIQYVVDHIVPISGRLVSGLHCFANLQVITWTENSKKSYHFIDELICC